MYAGLIHGAGPRYCPSIEDKIVRFAERESHGLFLEPEGRSTYEVYLQGCSTSLPIAVQKEIIKSLPGLAETAMIRPAYAVEYDYLPAIQFNHSLMAKDLHGFFAAGQMLGTSGYEEAAAQGIMAGINAALYVLDRPPFTLPRSSSYLATLIDDLVSKEIHEPYRMMTSRSEYRLLLRQDNADSRLTPAGRAIGVIDENRWRLFNEKYEAIEKERRRLRTTRVNPSPDWQEKLAPCGEELKQAATLEELLRRPQLPYAVIEAMLPASADEPFAWAQELETEIKYAGYIERQKNQVQQMEKLDALRLPADISYQSLLNLSKEAREKLERIKPETVGQAGRIAGVSPADISVLLVCLEVNRRQKNVQNQAPDGTLANMAIIGRGAACAPANTANSRL